ncbi:MAG: type I methionyl aminopeptidase [Oscillospiraceae bacterium]|jgi:methionyl aminopeptidase|nr:type I methionyl aminopeptidase [Oscillospiraceae bacterium]
MIILKTDRELQSMKKAGRIAAGALNLAKTAVKPGVTTIDIDRMIRDYIESQGAKPSFLGYGGFPASACISVNNMVIHGIPSKTCVLKQGDIVSIDVGACFEGYHGDTAATFSCETISNQAQSLIDVTKESLFEAIKIVRAGSHIGDISSTVQGYVESRGYSIVRDFVGHGVGTKLHEDPSVPNFGVKGRGLRLDSGMTIAIEPMVNMGKPDVTILPDGSVITSDGSLSAHFEHTIAITMEGSLILTLED